MQNHTKPFCCVQWKHNDKINWLITYSKKSYMSLTTTHLPALWAHPVCCPRDVDTLHTGWKWRHSRSIPTPMFCCWWDLSKDNQDTLCCYWEGNNSLWESENYRPFILGQFYAFFFKKASESSESPCITWFFPFLIPLRINISHSWSTLAPADELRSIHSYWGTALTSPSMPCHSLTQWF